METTAAGLLALFFFPPFLLPLLVLVVVLLLVTVVVLGELMLLKLSMAEGDTKPSMSKLVHKLSCASKALLPNRSPQSPRKPSPLLLQLLLEAGNKSKDCSNN